MLARSVFRAAAAAAAAAQRRLYSAAPAGSPPLLLKIRSDMKDAMRAKDTNKLNVCRSLIAEISNASKTPTPPTTDIHLLSLITRTLDKSAGSLREFAAAGRADLAAKEAAQMAVLEGYAALVERVGADEIARAVRTAMDAAGAKARMGDVMKAVMAAFEGRPVVQADVAAAVQGALKK